MRGVDVEPVSAWLVDHIEGCQSPFRFELIAGGRSNLTYIVTDANGRRMVLRRPPLGQILATAHDMAREYRIISALVGTGVPVAETLGVCTEPAVNGETFYVMDYVDGVVLSSPDRAETLTAPQRHAAALSLIETLVALHGVNVDDVGLGDLSKRDRYIERQLKRWSTQWASSKQRDLPEVEEVERRLRANVPEQRGVSIVHGDYRFGNCMVDPVRATINAVLDWELCTLGDPLADVGWLLVYWSDPGETRSPQDPTAAGGFVSRAELVARYGDLSGRDVTRVAYYEAFGLWRLACISEGVYARYRRGAMGDDGVDLEHLRLTTERASRAALAASQSAV